VSSDPLDAARARPGENESDMSHHEHLAMIGSDQKAQEDRSLQEVGAGTRLHFGER
jgi:hypothetical protein